MIIKITIRLIIVFWALFSFFRFILQKLYNTVSNKFAAPIIKMEIIQDVVKLWLWSWIEDPKSLSKWHHIRWATFCSPTEKNMFWNRSILLQYHRLWSRQEQIFKMISYSRNSKDLIACSTMYYHCAPTTNLPFVQFQ